MDFLVLSTLIIIAASTLSSTMTWHTQTHTWASKKLLSNVRSNSWRVCPLRKALEVVLESFKTVLFLDLIRRTLAHQYLDLTKLYFEVANNLNTYLLLWYIITPNLTWLGQEHSQVADGIVSLRKPLIGFIKEFWGQIVSDVIFYSKQ